MVATGQHRISRGSVRFFPEVLKLTSYGKKYLDIASCRHVNQGRLGQSHLLQRVSISLTNTGKGKLLAPEKTAHSDLIPDDTPIVHVFSDVDFFRHFLGIQHTYIRVEESSLSISFNDQSQDPDIPIISSRVVMMIHTFPKHNTK
jgi:hypothetical protein